MGEERNLEVIFNKTCEEKEESPQECDVYVEHDDFLNGGRSTFEVGETIYYNVFPSGSYFITKSNGGTISIVCPRKINAKSEKITFSGSNEATLSYPLDGSFTYSWIGSAIRVSDRTKCTPNILATKGSKKIVSKESVYGSVNVVYEYSSTSISFIPINSGDQTLLFCKLCESTEEYVCDSITENIEDIVTEDVTVTIIDACEDGPVAGAQISVDGNLIETVSGEDGKIHLGVLSKGEHDIIVTAPGYVSSADDTLSNDSIIVG